MQLRTFVIALLIALSVFALFGCGHKETEPSTTPSGQTSSTATPSGEEGVAAYVNGQPIAREELATAKEGLISYYQQLYAQFGQDIRSMLTGARGRALDLNLEVNALEQLFFNTIINQEAEKRGVKPTDEQIEAEFQQQYTTFLSDHNVTEEQLAEYLTGEGSSLDQFKSDARKSVADQLTVQAVREAVAGEIDLTDDQIESYFEENRDRYDTEEEVRASHILVKTKEEAQEILDELAEVAGIEPDSPAGGADLQVEPVIGAPDERRMAGRTFQELIPRFARATFSSSKF